jgi:hypothetical protein
MMGSPRGHQSRHSGARQEVRATRGPKGVNPESRAITSGFRVRTRKARVRPGMTIGKGLDRLVALLLAMMATFVAVGTSARAQQDAAATLKKDMIGQWELSTTERSKTCVVTLKDGPAQNLKLELEPGCAAALPFTKDITAWSIKGLGDIVRLQDAAGQPVIDFTEVESGIFEGLRSGEGVYILQNLAAARSLAKSMDQMIGDWSMVRGNGQTVCGLTLTNTEATADNFQVFLKPKCDPAVAAFAPTQWRLERGQMLLMNVRGDTWQFEADDNAQWRRVPDTADPLILVRQ